MQWNEQNMFSRLIAQQKDDSKFQVLLSDYLLTVSTNLEGAQQQLLMRVLRMQALLKRLFESLIASPITDISHQPPG